MNKKLYDVPFVLATPALITVSAFNKKDAAYRAQKLLYSMSLEDILTRLKSAMDLCLEFNTLDGAIKCVDEDGEPDDYSECEACKNVDRCRYYGVYHIVCGECVHESDIEEDDNDC